MNDRIFEALKLLNDDSLLVSETELSDFMEYLVQQSSGWGLRQRDRVALTLARKAAEGVAAIAELDETKRKLKGLQLELGRVRKQLEKAQFDAAAVGAQTASGPKLGETAE